MPELPEVETLRRALEPVLARQRINRVRAQTRSIISMPGDPVAGFSRARSSHAPTPVRTRLLLRGCTIERLERLGKQMAICTREGPAICVQLGMTGGLSVSATPRAHEHVVWTLGNGVRLAFSDARRFGLIGCHQSFEDLHRQRWMSLGPDALTITTRQLAGACSTSARPIKALLLDQSALAGVGNIYADESLFRAGIHPQAPAEHLSPGRIRKLAKAIREVLRAAIQAGGSSIRDFRTIEDTLGDYQARHSVYGRAGQPCLRCACVLQSLTLAQRTTVFCPNCQRPAIGAS